MANTNLVCVSPATISLESEEDDKRVRPIGIAIKKIADYLPQSDVNFIRNSYFRGDATVKGVITDFMKGEVPFVHRPIDAGQHFEIALKFVHDAFKPPEQYRPVHFCDLRFYPWELSTSAEEPLVSDPKLIAAVKKAHKLGDLPNTRMSKSVLYNAAFGYNRDMVHNIKETPNPKGKKISFFPAVAHARSHLTPIEDEAKIRMVFGIPWLFLMVELMLLWPLINWFRKGLTPLAWTYEIMNGGMWRLNQKVKLNDLYLCLDWKQFDKRAQYDIIDKIHKMWSSWMRYNGGYIPTSQYPDSTEGHTPAQFEKRIQRLWKWMNQYTKYMDIRLPDGSHWTKKYAGIASGMLQTQMLDSFINLFVLITCLVILKVPLPEVSLILGDDSVLIIRSMGHVDTDALLKAISHTAEKYFGFVLNLNKSIVTNNPSQITFLGYTNQNGLPTRDRLETLAKLVHPEREWNSEKVKARALGFAYANCGVDEVVHYVCKDIFDSLPHVTPRESGSPFLRFYRETVGSYDPTVFPSRDVLLNKLFVAPDRAELDQQVWPSWYFLSEY